MLKWLSFIALGLVGLVAIVALIGTLIPKRHRASRTAVYAASPATVFAIVSDFARFPEWRSDVTAVDMLGDGRHGVRFREQGRNGAVTYRVEVRETNSKLVTRVDDPSQPFGGTWTLEVKPVPEGTSLTITEDGEIYNPVFRVLSRVVFSPYTTIDTYQADLRKRLAARGATPASH